MDYQPIAPTDKNVKRLGKTPWIQLVSAAAESGTEGARSPNIADVQGAAIDGRQIAPTPRPAEKQLLAGQTKHF